MSWIFDYHNDNTHLFKDQAENNLNYSERRYFLKASEQGYVTAKNCGLYK